MFYGTRLVHENHPSSSKLLACIFFWGNARIVVICLKGWQLNHLQEQGFSLFVVGKKREREAKTQVPNRVKSAYMDIFSFHEYIYTIIT